ncbi:hypothetical protein DID73_01230 [Candidatus Marinamargulisbacteria bacterium SCGC AG-343-K17]|nr:hypothetical protein DID73_01230 [Candidatus Marinamargulisbacteria bacterium SCGC AG-343-K17]
MKKTIAGFSDSFFVNSDFRSDNYPDQLKAIEVDKLIAYNSRKINYFDLISSPGFVFNTGLATSDTLKVDVEKIPDFIRIATIINDDNQIQIIKDFLKHQNYTFCQVKTIIDRLKQSNIQLDEDLKCSLFSSAENRFEELCIRLYCDDPLVTEFIYGNISPSKFHTQESQYGIDFEYEKGQFDIEQFSIALENNTYLKSIIFQEFPTINSKKTTVFLESLKTTQISKLILRGVQFTAYDLKLISGIDSLTALSLLDNKLNDKNFKLLGSLLLQLNSFTIGEGNLLTHAILDYTEKLFNQRLDTPKSSDDYDYLRVNLHIFTFDLFSSLSPKQYALNECPRRNTLKYSFMPRCYSELEICGNLTNFQKSTELSYDRYLNGKTLPSMYYFDHYLTQLDKISKKKQFFNVEINAPHSFNESLLDQYRQQLTSINSIVVSRNSENGNYELKAEVI